MSAKPGFTFAARWTKSVTEGQLSSASSDAASGAGSSSGGRPNSDSAPILSGARLVAITCSEGQRATSAAMSPAASSTCSRLSSTRSTRRSPMTVASASRAERPWASAMSSAMATVGSTSAAAVTEASDTKAAPPAYSGARRRKSSIEKRVLPVPP